MTHKFNVNDLFSDSFDFSDGIRTTLSRFENFGNRERAIAAGFDSYIAKPINLGDVRAQAQLLSSRRSSPERLTLLFSCMGQVQGLALQQRSVKRILSYSSIATER